MTGDTRSIKGSLLYVIIHNHLSLFNTYHTHAHTHMHVHMRMHTRTHAHTHLPGVHLPLHKEVLCSIPVALGKVDKPGLLLDRQEVLKREWPREGGEEGGRRREGGEEEGGGGREGRRREGRVGGMEGEEEGGRGGGRGGERGGE